MVPSPGEGGIRIGRGLGFGRTAIAVRLNLGAFGAPEYASLSEVVQKLWPQGAFDGNRLRIGPVEAIDGTPVVDIKLVLR